MRGHGQKLVVILSEARARTPILFLQEQIKDIIIIKVVWSASRDSASPVDTASQFGMRARIVKARYKDQIAAYISCYGVGAH
jgi:hypothetical protein